METMQRLTITDKKKTEKTPIAFRSRDIERDCRSIVKQLMNSIPKDVFLRISYVGSQQLTSPQPTHGVSVQLKSIMARRIHIVDGKKKYEPC